MELLSMGYRIPVEKWRVKLQAADNAIRASAGKRECWCRKKPLQLP